MWKLQGSQGCSASRSLAHNSESTVCVCVCRAACWCTEGSRHLIRLHFCPGDWEAWASRWQPWQRGLLPEMHSSNSNAAQLQPETFQHWSTFRPGVAMTVDSSQNGLRLRAPESESKYDALLRARRKVYHEKQLDSARVYLCACSLHRKPGNCYISYGHQVPGSS